MCLLGMFSHAGPGFIALSYGLFQFRLILFSVYLRSPLHARYFRYIAAHSYLSTLSHLQIRHHTHSLLWSLLRPFLTFPSTCFMYPLILPLSGAFAAAYFSAASGLALLSMPGWASLWLLSALFYAVFASPSQDKLSGI